MSSLKPFVINLNDLAFLLEQVNFVPLFDAQGNAVVNWTGATAIYDSHGVLLSNGSSDPAQQALLVQQFGRIDPVTGSYVAGFPEVSAPIGIRDVTGFHNNLYGTQADWGAVDVPFVRQMPADYSNYVTTAGANYDPDLNPGLNVVDLMPRIISRTITTGGVNLLTDLQGHYVEWSADRYGTDTAYKTLIDDSGVDITQLVEGAKIVAPVTTTTALDSLSWDPTAYSASNFYRLGINTLAATLGDGHIYGSATGGAPVDGETIYYFDGTGYQALKVGGVELKLDVASYVYKSLVDALDTIDTSFNRTTAAPGATIHIPTGYNPDPVGDVDPAVILSTVQTSSGYGLLEQIGHIDFQNPTSGEYFIGSENPGVAPVNSWFGIFGQFFDHGLDFIGKGGSGTITIALSPGDPLYDEAPNHAITISRATPTGTDANGDAAYVNHTSPFIDQSQTYGSNEQITSILREWVSTDGNATYHAGMELFDGTTLADSWTRKLPVYNATTGLFETVESQVNNTLPTLNELRAHLLDTGRDDLTWEDVSNLRNRDLVTGDVITSGPGAGHSGHALILDMNPHFDGVSGGTGHIDLSKLQAIDSHINGITSGGPGLITITYDNGPAKTLGDLVNFADFSIKTVGTGAGQITQAEHDVANEILLESVGDHYIAGDGRVNENFGLTSIHHVFHEEHNYQAENLKTWIYAHDANNPGTTDSHEQLHNWQVNNHLAANNTDARGNYLNADGSISWDADKMFGATKLIVEMEYQHAAVDQYARTVTPRIQEFVGYSTGVDSTISLEYAQVAFRFGHSTIRETIDALDPSGWYSGHVMRYALEQAFLAPQTFAEEGVAAITLGLTHQQMNEVDELVTPALSQGLLGQPLDLPAINIARGRDLGIPTLNDFRAGVGLAEYTSWDDFGKNMIHPESLVNFIAAYSFADPTGVADIAISQAKAKYLLDLADGAPELAANDPANPFGVLVTYAQAVAFLTNSPVIGNAELEAARDNFDQIDSWIGGLAEAHVPGGLLGETFDAVFVAQIQALMDGDRFYYLYRLFGTQIHEEVNNGQFKDIVERNTGLEHLNGSIFAYADKYYDFGLNSGQDKTTANDDFAHHIYVDSIEGKSAGIYSDGGANLDPNGSDITVTASDGIRASVTLDLIRDVRPDLQPDLVHPVEGTPTDGADSHEVIVASDFADFIHARSGDDTVYGEDGDDYIYGDGGVDRMYGGDGNDMIDTGEGPDLADGGAGKDIVYGRGSGSEVGGFDQLVGGSGNDLLVGGEGIDKLSSGAGDDIVFGDGLTNPEMGNTDPFTHGGDGNDYIDGGASGDILLGEEGDDYIVGGNDQDLMQGGLGDDIIRPGNPSQASGTTGGPDEVLGDDGQANAGFDLIDFSDYAGSAPGVTVDFATQNNPLVNIDQTTTFPAWFQIEGAIGSRNADTFIGDSDGDATADNSHGNNWLIGGSGSDTFTGAGGNDLIIGGSIRLDALIGSYTGADFGTLSLGSGAWIADAMQTGGSGTGYDDNTEIAYTGASNRALGTIGGNGLIDAANALGGGQFDKHFTDMLQSRMFKDVVLGDGGADGTADTVVFTGQLSEYSIEVINTTAPNGETVQALKVTDHGGLVDDGTGVLVARAEDGVDLIVGVETGVFADQTVSLIPSQPVLDLSGVTTTTTTSGNVRDEFAAANYTLNAGSASWSGNWIENNSEPNGGSPTTGDIQIASGRLNFGSSTDGNETITRNIDLTGATSATLSFDWQEVDRGNGEDVLVQVRNVTNNNWLTVGTMSGSASNGTASFTYDFSASQMGASSGIRFASQGQWEGTDSFFIDNVNVAFTKATTSVAPGGSNNYSTAYVENGNRVAIASPAAIADDSATMAWAKVVLTNAVAGDALRMGNSDSDGSNLGSGVAYSVDSSVAGQITLTISGQATRAQYQGFIDQVRFFSTSDNPTSADRTINITVNDGVWTSNVATTTVHVIPVDDPFQAGNDSVVTNITGTSAIVIPDWALLANDRDPDGPPSVVNSIGTQTSLTASHVGTGVTVSDSGSSSIAPNDMANGTLGSFVYQSSSGASTGNAAVSVTRDTNNISSGTGNQILVGDGTASTFSGGAGNDIVIAGDGNDSIVWNVSFFGDDGHDIVDGGDGTDTFTLTSSILFGTSSNETFDIYTVAEALTAGITGLNANTEIVIARNGAVAAELDNVEEIVINTGPGTNQFPANGGTGDKIYVHGNFTGTSLNYSTITINGSAGDDTVDISGLTSDHRVVFNSNGGNDAVIGTLRPQDVIDLDDVLRGTTAADRLNGGSGHDWVLGLAGNDRLLGGIGNDTVRGGAGRDFVNGGSGDDILSGGAGHDLFVFREGFGHDVITDFDANPAGGQDKILLRMDIEDDNFAQHVRIVDAGRDTIVRIDGQEIRLAGVADHHSVTVQDFVLA